MGDGVWDGIIAGAVLMGLVGGTVTLVWDLFSIKEKSKAERMEEQYALHDRIREMSEKATKTGVASTSASYVSKEIGSDDDIESFYDTEAIIAEENDRLDEQYYQAEKERELLADEELEAERERERLFAQMELDRMQLEDEMSHLEDNLRDIDDFTQDSMSDLNTHMDEHHNY